MDKEGSSLHSHRVIREGSKVSLEVHSPPTLLEFDIKESYMVSYGIDRHASPDLQYKTLPHIVGNDAETLGSNFHAKIALPMDNIKCYVWSKAEEHCTFDGIHDTFLESARKVGTDGIFVFCFTGYGGKVGDNEWGLSPADFDYTEEKLITAATIIGWLQGVKFKGKYALFVLDCCYAGGIAKQLCCHAGGIAEQLANKTVNDVVPIPELFAFTSCTENETSAVVNALGHSIFNYFFTSCLLNSNSQPGQLMIKAVYEDCNACCKAFSSLLLSHQTANDVLKWRMIQPEFKYFQLSRYLPSLYQEEHEETDTGPPGQFQFVTEYYEFQKKGSRQEPPVLTDKALNWLETVSQPEGALFELHNRQLLVGQLLLAAIASMMYSMASIFIVCNQDNKDDINIFIVSFYHVITAVDRVQKNLKLTRHDLRLALEYYCDALRRQEINAGELRSLYKRIVNDIAAEQLQAASSPEKEGQVFASSGDMSQKSSTEATSPSHSASIDDGINIPELTEWIPAVWYH